MVWLLTRGHHELSCNRFVRFWLRQPFFRRLAIIIFVTAVAASLAALPQYRGLGVALAVIVGGFGLLDLIGDAFFTRASLANLAACSDVILSTRAEYRGGHPYLPKARFVYLLLAGSLESPQLRIFLPGRTPVFFGMPLLDLEQTRSVLTHVISRNSVLGRAPIFEIEYSGDTGRKRRVEFWFFFRKAEEVYQWRNFVVCLQHEADSGERPYGKWKSLPKQGPATVETPAGVFAGAKFSQ